MTSHNTKSFLISAMIQILKRIKNTLPVMVFPTLTHHQRIAQRTNLTPVIWQSSLATNIIRLWQHLVYDRQQPSPTNRVSNSVRNSSFAIKRPHRGNCSDCLTWQFITQKNSLCGWNFSSFILLLNICVWFKEQGTGFVATLIINGNEISLC